MPMLVLTRKKNERIIITTADGQVIYLVVVEILSEKVRIGIEAPKDIRINREEVQLRMRKEK